MLWSDFYKYVKSSYVSPCISVSTIAVLLLVYSSFTPFIHVIDTALRKRVKTRFRKSIHPPCDLKVSLTFKFQQMNFSTMKYRKDKQHFPLYVLTGSTDSNQDLTTETEESTVLPCTVAYLSIVKPSKLLRCNVL